MSVDTTGVVLVDGGVTRGAIEFVDAGALFKLTLLADKSYVIRSVRNGLPDPYLVLYGTDGVLITFDDDSAGSLNAEILYTATASGTYYPVSYTHLDVYKRQLSNLFTISGVASGIDTYTQVEYFQFADVLRTLNQLVAIDISAPNLVSINPADNALSLIHI